MSTMYQPKWGNSPPCVVRVVSNYQPCWRQISFFLDINILFCYNFLRKSSKNSCFYAIVGLK